MERQPKWPIRDQGRICSNTWLWSQESSAGQSHTAWEPACCLKAGKLSVAVDVETEEQRTGEARFMPNFGKLLDKAKQFAGKHPNQVNKGVGQGEQYANEK